MPSLVGSENAHNRLRPRDFPRSSTSLTLKVTELTCSSPSCPGAHRLEVRALSVNKAFTARHEC